MMFLKQIQLGPLDNFVYVIADNKTKECAVVDPAWNVSKIWDVIEEEHLNLTSLLVTHAHPDHINGISKILQSQKCRIYVHLKDAWQNADIVKLKDNAIIRLGGLNIKVIHTPGHTPGSVCYLVEDFLFTGDTLFNGCCGRTDLEGGNPEQLYNSLQKIKKLNNNIKILPGHNYGKDRMPELGNEKLHNPLMKLSKEEFIKKMGG